MDQVRLGNSGLKVSRLCLGCLSFGDPNWRGWVKDLEGSEPFFRDALDKGITFFDTANFYSMGRSEEITGHWLKAMARRQDVVIGTKVFYPMSDRPTDRGLSRRHIMDQVDASLKRLGTDYIDLYQVHRFDDETPIEETLEALNDIVRAGKVRYLGASTMFAWQFARMLAVQEKNGWARFISMQPQYNLVEREEEREMLPLCLAEGVGVTPWSPIAGGFLARGNTATVRGQRDNELYHRTPEDHAIFEVVQAVARERGLSNMQVAMAWVMRHPAIVAPVVGASRLSHIDDAISALDVRLSDEEAARLEALYRPKAVTDH